MKPPVDFFFEDLQVGWLVIPFVTIDVVNLIPTPDGPPEFLFGNSSVGVFPSASFGVPELLVSGIVGAGSKAVAASSRITAGC
jgi:hypothetical protein